MLLYSFNIENNRCEDTKMVIVDSLVDKQALCTLAVPEAACWFAAVIFSRPAAARA